MSLTDFFQSFKYRTLTQTPSPLGGYVESWIDGATFSAGIGLDTSAEARIAYQNTLKKQYSIILPDGVTLTQDMRVKQVSTGTIYRITSNSADAHTPAIAGVSYAKVTAEVIE
ncbi:MAG: head-tail adaptor protein [Dehalococcoidia bacterium]|jgi:head-tail adaptor